MPGKYLTAISFALLLLLAACRTRPEAPAAGAEDAACLSGWREDFNRPGDDGVPAGWRYEPGPFGVPPLAVDIVEAPDAEDGRALRLESEGASGIVITDAWRHIDLEATPVMHWRWRVLEPVAAAARDDQALVVYFGAIDWLLKKSIGYRWEDEAAVGAEGDAAYAGGMVRVRYFVLRDRTTTPGVWVEEYRNVRDDFFAAYDYVPDKFAVMVGANSQYTGEFSSAEVDYIEFLSEAEAARRQTQFQP